MAIESILNSIKKLHGISPEDDSFDTDITIHINKTLLQLNQVGVGPAEGFYIEDDTKKWGDFVANKFIAETIKSYVYAKVRLVFDPPASPTVVAALESSAAEDIWRIEQWAAENNTI